MGRRIRLDQYLPDGAARLARAVHARRDELGLTRDQIGKPSGTTIYSIELERKSQYDSSIMSSLEQGLHWKPGSVDRVLHGEDPVSEDAEEEPEPLAAQTLPQQPSETYNHRQERLSRRALYRMMRAMGEMYGSGMIMEVAAEVVTDLQGTGELASDSHD